MKGGDEVTLVVFRTRTDVFSFIDLARSAGIGASIVSMPKELKLGCGLAVRISDNRTMKAWSILKKAGYSSFFGIFTLKKTSSGKKLTRIV